MFVRAYLRASTDAQDAKRAKGDLQSFAKERGLRIASWYVENESGATINRPELKRLLNDSHPGDVLLVEQVDRLSRLNKADWDELKSIIKTKRVRVVALDLPTSHRLAAESDDFEGRMLDAINDMMLDMLAAIARKDYDDRRRRQAQGIEKAKESGKYKGRKPDDKKRLQIRRLLNASTPWSEIVETLSTSRSTILSVKQEMDAEKAQEAA
ncbi:recombinase family protein [Cupriavidus nantongensis]|uniref:Resolvase n=1 Tax=Cupriavidus nantongensis TaxID=1796606 RepID=A0A142JNH2_9BURK|nr:recombinase family protein [Cupriavidus nantongensis]AMR79634.1 resolvase [Cupriavidus nantongensis]